MNQPRFIAVDTSALNDGDALRFDATTHAIIGAPPGQGSAPPAIREIELTGNRTLTNDEVSAQKLVVRGTPATVTFPSTRFWLQVANETSGTLTVKRSGGTPTTITAGGIKTVRYIP